MQSPACLANCVHLGMGRGVVVGCHAIRASRNDLSVFHNDSAEESTAILHTVIGQPDGLAHELFIFVRNIHSYSLSF